LLLAIFRTNPANALDGVSQYSLINIVAALPRLNVNKSSNFVLQLLLEIRGLSNDSALKTFSCRDSYKVNTQREHSIPIGGIW